jgi:hypothetical protein
LGWVGFGIFKKFKVPSEVCCSFTPYISQKKWYLKNTTKGNRKGIMESIHVYAKVIHWSYFPVLTKYW